MIYFDPTIRERYARGLFNIAKRQNAVRDIMEELDEVLSILKPNQRVRLFMDSPSVPTENKVRLIRGIFEERVHPLVFKLIMLLMTKDRTTYLKPVLERFRVLVEQERGIYQAAVQTAVPLNDEEKQKLQTSLERFTKARLHIRYHVEPALIGGVRFTYGDMLIDDSVRGKLGRLRQQLQEAADQ